MKPQKFPLEINLLYSIIVCSYIIHIHAPQKRSLGVLHVFIFDHTKMHSVASQLCMTLLCKQYHYQYQVLAQSLIYHQMLISLMITYIRHYTSALCISYSYTCIEMCDGIIVVSDYCYYIFPQDALAAQFKECRLHLATFLPCKLSP